MRKMKRRSKKHEKEQQESENDNESVGNNDTNNSQNNESLESPEVDSEPEPETKKRKSDKRKSVSFSKKSSKIEADAEDEEEKEDEETEEEEEANYEVEEILGEKVVRGIKHYLIRWKGYESESDSWEPESTLNCPELIKQFKATQDENESGGEGQKKTKKSNKSKENGKKKDKNKKSKHSIKSKAKPKEVDWDSNDEFEVDRILDVYFRKNGQREFLVSWKGYPGSQDSWEPEENLVCSDLIKKFMAKVEEAKQWEAKDLRINPAQTARLTLRMYEGGQQRRLSRRLNGKQRIQYHDAE